MSVVAIRPALETALNAMSPALGTAFENGPVYVPATGTPYQRVNLILAEPSNNENNRYHMERGFLQVTLCYPQGAGPGAAAARAELIRATFYRGASFVSGSVTVTIDRTPEIAPAQIVDDRYVIPVRIRFYAHITA